MDELINRRKKNIGNRNTPIRRRRYQNSSQHIQSEVLRFLEKKQKLKFQHHQRSGTNATSTFLHSFKYPGSMTSTSNTSASFGVSNLRKSNPSMLLHEVLEETENRKYLSFNEMKKKILSEKVAVKKGPKKKSRHNYRYGTSGIPSSSSSSRSGDKVNTERQKLRKIHLSLKEKKTKKKKKMNSEIYEIFNRKTLPSRSKLISYNKDGSVVLNVYSNPIRSKNSLIQYDIFEENENQSEGNNGERRRGGDGTSKVYKVDDFMKNLIGIEKNNRGKKAMGRRLVSRRSNLRPSTSLSTSSSFSNRGSEGSRPSSSKLGNLNNSFSFSSQYQKKKKKKIRPITSGLTRRRKSDRKEDLTKSGDDGMLEKKKEEGEMGKRREPEFEFENSEENEPLRLQYDPNQIKQFNLPNHAMNSTLRDYLIMVEACNRAGKNRLEGLCHYRIGCMYEEKLNYVQSILHFKKFLYICNLLQDVVGQCLALNRIGVLYHLRGKTKNLKRALEYHSKHWKLSDKQNKIVAHLNMGLIYKKLVRNTRRNTEEENVKSAIDHFKAAFRYALEIDDKQGQSIALSNIGILRKKSGNINMAKKCIEKHLLISKSINDEKSKTEAYHKLGILAQKSGDTNKAIYMLKKARKIAKDHNDQQKSNKLKCFLGIMQGNSKFEEYIKYVGEQLKKRSMMNRESPKKEMVQKEVKKETKKKEKEKSESEDEETEGEEEEDFDEIESGEENFQEDEIDEMEEIEIENDEEDETDVVRSFEDVEKDVEEDKIEDGRESDGENEIEDDEDEIEDDEDEIEDDEDEIEDDEDEMEEDEDEIDDDDDEEDEIEDGRESDGENEIDDDDEIVVDSDDDDN